MVTNITTMGTSVLFLRLLRVQRSSAGTLTITSTSHATKGKSFGTLNNYWDEVNQRFVVGNPAHPQGGLHINGQGVFDNGLAFQFDSGSNTYNQNFQYSSGSGGYIDIQSFAGKPIVLNGQGNNVGIGRNNPV